MTSLGDILNGIRKVMLIEHRLNEMQAELKETNLIARDTRDRVMRLEGILQGAQAATKRLR